MNNSKLLIGVVIPVYMEAEIICSFHQKLIETINSLPYQFHIYYVDDGSTDNSLTILKNIALEDKRIVVIELSRNFGHQSALSAGISLADGDVIITMDGDGQHPPKLIPEMINLYNNGYDIVQTQREEGKSSVFKEITSNSFYWLINKISDTKILPGTADFRLMSRQVVETLKNLPEYHKFFRGLIPWMGFHTVIIPFTPLDRIGGKSKYSFKKMLSLAGDAIFSFSTTPIKLSIGLGVIFLAMALFEMVYALSFWFSNNFDKLAPGWTSLMFVTLLGNALILISVGTIGIYVGYIFQQVKDRPTYIIRSISKIQDK